MNVSYDMYDGFEWDPAKDRKNQQKHGISFSTGAKVFTSPDRRFRKGRIQDGEERWIAIGTVDNVPLFVVFCHREYKNGTKNIRIISARKASADERSGGGEASDTRTEG
jgi:uncharacterized DUF497 family protein